MAASIAGVIWVCSAARAQTVDFSGVYEGGPGVSDGFGVTEIVQPGQFEPGPFIQVVIRPAGVDRWDIEVFTDPDGSPFSIFPGAVSEIGLSTRNINGLSSPAPGDELEFGGGAEQFFNGFLHDGQLFDFSAQLTNTGMTHDGGSNDSPQAQKKREFLLFLVRVGDVPDPDPDSDANDFFWNVDFGGDFGDSNNWDPQQLPDAAETAVFARGSGQTVNLDGSRTVGAARFVTGGITFANGTLTASTLSPTVPSFDLDGGDVTIDPTATLQGVHAIVGRTADSTLVVDAGAVFDLSGRLTIGAEGAGEMFSLGETSAMETRLGDGGQPGSLIITDGVFDAGALVVGYQAPATPGELSSLALAGGAKLLSTAAAIGFADGAHGIVEVTTATPEFLDTQWTVSDSLFVGGGKLVDDTTGGNGTGQLDVTMGGRVKVRNLHVGTGGEGTVNVTGEFPDGIAEQISTLDAEFIEVGALTPGSLHVKDFASVRAGRTGTAAEAMIIGGDAEGEVIVENSGQIGTFKRLVIGEQAHGLLHVRDGGEFFAFGQVNVLDGSVVVEGGSSLTASTVRLSEQLTIGDGSAAASLEVNDGGLVETNSSQGVSVHLLPNSSLDVSAGAMFASNYIIEGEARVTDGGLMQAFDEISTPSVRKAIGIDRGGELTVDGLDSEVVSDVLSMIDGDGLLTITNGALVNTTSEVFIGTDGFGVARVGGTVSTPDGPRPSQWLVQRDPEVGGPTPALLTVEEGNAVAAFDGGYLRAERLQVGSTTGGELQVFGRADGLPATVVASTELDIRNGFVSVTQGGLLGIDNIISQLTDKGSPTRVASERDASVHISGVKDGVTSTMRVHTLFLGADAVREMSVASVSVEDGGALLSEQSPTRGHQSQFPAFIGFSSPASLTVQGVNAETNSASAALLGDTFMADVISSGSLNALDGGFIRINRTLRVGSTSTVRIAGGGRIVVEASRTGVLAGIANQLVLGTGGTLAGTGTVVGDITVAGGVNNFAGTVRPGSSPGVLTIDGNYYQGAEGVLEIEITGTTPGVDYDQLMITGDAVIDGILNLRFQNGFAPSAGQEFMFTTVMGSGSGAFREVNIVGLAPGFDSEVSYAGGQFRLIALNDGVFVPEPGTLALAALALVGLALARRRKRAGQ